MLKTGRLSAWIGESTIRRAAAMREMKKKNRKELKVIERERLKWKTQEIHVTTNILVVEGRGLALRRHHVLKCPALVSLVGLPLVVRLAKLRNSCSCRFI